MRKAAEPNAVQPDAAHVLFPVADSARESELDSALPVTPMEVTTHHQRLSTRVISAADTWDAA